MTAPNSNQIWVPSSPAFVDVEQWEEGGLDLAQRGRRVAGQVERQATDAARRGNH